MLSRVNIIHKQTIAVFDSVFLKHENPFGYFDEDSRYWRVGGKTDKTAKRVLFETKNVGGYVERYFD